MWPVGAARKVECVIVGGILALVAWIAIVPWDLSEVDQAGTVIDRSRDHVDARILAALLIITVLYVVVAVLWMQVPIGWVSIGTSIVWMTT